MFYRGVFATFEPLSASTSSDFVVLYKLYYKPSPMHRVSNLHSYSR